MNIDNVVLQALKEDIGSGDITTQSTVPKTTMIAGAFLAKEGGVVAGLEVVRRVFALRDSKIQFSQKISDGTEVNKRTIVATVHGPAWSILSSERVALNFLQRMSGIATQTKKFVQAVKGTNAVILDTRKTAPGLRYFDKWSVRLGGGQNHRYGLFDMVLIKDNHIAASGGIRHALAAVRKKTHAPIEVEVTTIKQLKEAVALRPDRIMLDNMDVYTIKRAVRLVANRVPIEVSGGVNLQTVRSIAKTGVQYISIGALTHSVKALDISLEIVGE
jgi:nicotinate-nucleotide pyrophosphorylase (carboxylating)